MVHQIKLSCFCCKTIRIELCTRISFAIQAVLASNVVVTVVYIKTYTMYPFSVICVLCDMQNCLPAFMFHAEVYFYYMIIFILAYNLPNFSTGAPTVFCRFLQAMSFMQLVAISFVPLPFVILYVYRMQLGLGG